MMSEENGMQYVYRAAPEINIFLLVKQKENVILC